MVELYDHNDFRSRSSSERDSKFIDPLAFAVMRARANQHTGCFFSSATGREATKKLHKQVNEQKAQIEKMRGELVLLPGCSQNACCARHHESARTACSSPLKIRRAPGPTASARAGSFSKGRRRERSVSTP